MARSHSAPPYPVDLGSWIACFRHRLRNEDGHPLSPEQLGQELGVSGATVRRWEAGSAQPRAQDIVHLAQACRLTPVQRAFLDRALAATAIVLPPDRAVFRRQARAMLTSPFPAYLLDDLYHIRAWNSYVEVLPARVDQLDEGQFLEIALAEGVVPEQRQKALIRDFWLLTADKCGLPEYRRILRSLQNVPGFREAWTALALDTEPPDAPPVGAPTTVERPGGGAFRVHATQVFLPPVYHLREYVPVDETANRRLEDLRRQGPPTVHFQKHVHWAGN